MPPPLILTGPTASGKSALALDLARRHGAVIVSADAMTVYRQLDIGTAKPTTAEREAARHFCVDIRDPEEDFSVEEFVEICRAVCAEHPRVIIAGGTPFYLSALVRPLAELPSADPGVRAELERLPDPHAELLRVDPETAARLHPNDRVRVIRALEVYRLTGTAMSALHARGPRRTPLDAPVVWLDREHLRGRIDARIEQMVKAGYLDEVRAVLAGGCPPDARPLRSFAYRHLVAHLRGELTLDEALRRTARDTWRFARKQRTWGRSMGWSTDPRDVSEILEQHGWSSGGGRGGARSGSC